jgi:hypothetical protein
MPTIFYSETETGFSYSLVVTKEEAVDISTAAPGKAQHIELPDTGGFIDFDDNGNATITSSQGKHSYTYSSHIVQRAKKSLSDDDNQ